MHFPQSRGAPTFRSVPAKTITDSSASASSSSGKPASMSHPISPKMGDLLGARNIAALADRYALLVVPPNVASPVGTMAAAQLCAAMPNFFALEFDAFTIAW